MKNVKYMGQTFNVPDEAKFIAADCDGNVYTFSAEPTFGGDVWWRSDSDTLQAYAGIVDIIHPPCEAC